MSNENLEGETRLCTIAFTTPSIEPNGGVRLCSSNSIMSFPNDETVMGNAVKDGLHSVWTGEKYTAIRSSLLSGRDLKPYCASCVYVHTVPVWVMQLHMALHAVYGGEYDGSVFAIIRKHADRYSKYVEILKGIGVQPHQMADTSTATVPSLDRLISAEGLPLWMDFNTLNRCNVSCTMCPPAIWRKSNKNPLPYYRLTVEEYEKLTDGLNVKSSHFVGAYAEPLLNKDIFNLIARATEKGSFSAITSNAMALSEDFCHRLISAGLGMITVSIHGATAKTAEAIMLGSKFERIVGNMRRMQEVKAKMGKQNPDLYLSYVLQRLNIDELPDFIDLAIELKAVHLNIIQLIDGGENVDKTADPVLHPERLQPAIREAVARAKGHPIYLNISPAIRAFL